MLKAPFPELKDLPSGRVFAFEPGDGTRYAVGFCCLSREDSVVFGWGSRLCCLFTFGPASGPLRSAILPVFEVQEFGYFAQQMGGPRDWTLEAAYLAFCGMVELIPMNPPRPASELRWRNGWERQLLWKPEVSHG